MQLMCEFRDIDEAMAEFDAAVPFSPVEIGVAAEALASIIADHEHRHKPRRALRRQLARFRAGQLTLEVAA